MNYYQHHIGDFNNATRHLTRVERSLYRDLIELYYDKEQPLTSDTKTLCRKIIAKTDEEIEAVEQILNEFFILTNEVYVHKKCQSIIDNYKENLTKKSKAGKASAIARAKKTTQVEQVLNKCATNQEPITNNHKPITKDQKNIRENSDEISTQKKPALKIPFKKILELYHEMLPTLPKIEKLTKTREGFIRQRWIEDLPDLKNWSNYFDYVRESDFLMGRCEPMNGKRVFRADLEWLTRPSNFAKVSEEKYHS